MKFNSLFNKKVEKSTEDKKKSFSFKKMLAVGATTLTLMSCDVDSNVDYSGWNNDKEEVSDTDKTEVKDTYCDSSLLDKNFSNNISLEKGEYMYLFNGVKITFEELKNQKYNFTVQPQNSSPEILTLLKNNFVQVKNNKEQYNILEFCSYDTQKNIVSIASDDSFLPYLFKDGESEIIEKRNGQYEQIIHREYYHIEGNSITDKLFIQEKNWIFPPLTNLEYRTTLTFDNEEWLVGDLSSSNFLFKESAYYNDMPKDSTLQIENNNTITFLSTINEEGKKYGVFELKGESTQKVIIPENEMLSIIFENQKINLYVGKINDNNCDLSVISKYMYSGNKVDYEIYGIQTTAYVNFSDWDNTSKLELCPHYSFENLIKRKEREE